MLYYEDEFVQLHHGDCRAIRGWTRADVLVTDPPYGISYQSGQRTRSLKADRIANDEDTTARDSALAIWGSERPAVVFGTWRAPAPKDEKQRLIWWKRTGGFMGDVRIPWGTAHENIHILGKGWRVPDGLLRAQSVIPTSVGMGGTDGVVAQSGHPTAKPIGLMEYLIERVPPGVIADPFAGGGATLIAARNLGRKVIGVELEERYCELIVKRLSQQAFDFSALEVEA